MVKMKQKRPAVNPRPKFLLSDARDSSINILKSIKQLKQKSQRGEQKRLLDDAEKISELIIDLTKNYVNFTAEEAIDRLEFVEPLFDTLLSMVDSFFASESFSM